MYLKRCPPSFTRYDEAPAESGVNTTSLLLPRQTVEDGCDTGAGGCFGGTEAFHGRGAMGRATRDGGRDMTTASRLENGAYVDGSDDVKIPETAHQISSVVYIWLGQAALPLIKSLFVDSWLQVGFILTTGVNSAYVLGYSATIMVPLGWIPAVLGLLAANAISLYANILVAKLHEHGGRRHIRYRDLAGFIYGKKAYSLTWGLQYVNLFMINTGFIILAGSSLKAVYLLFRVDDFMKLPYFIAVAGLVCALFAIGIPHLSALRIWLAVSTFFSVIYIVIAIVLAAHDGTMSPPRDYSIPGTSITKIFTTVGAAANLLFAFNTGMLPEIQATIRKPVVGNMLKALYFQFTIGVFPLFAVAIVGYWAYGSKTPTYLLSGVSGPVWLKILANVSAFLQTVISLHIFASPMYEYLDTKFNVTGGALEPRSLSSRIGLRGGYLAVNTFVAALVPFLGDFMSLTGAISIIPLTFILASHMYLMAKESKLSSLMKLWHWANVAFFGFVSVAAAVAALRLIALDSKTYHLFADL